MAECNEAMARLLDLPVEELVGATLDQVWRIEPEVKLAAALGFIRNGYRLVDVESTGYRLDGTLRWVRTNLTGVVEDGHLRGGWGTHLDITDRKRAEEALQASEARLLTLFASMSDVILVLDAKGTVIEIAPTNPDPRYRPTGSELGKTVHDLFPPEQANRFEAAIRGRHRSL